MARLQFQRVPSIGQAAEGRKAIRALEDVGSAGGDIQYRSSVGAQARLPLATATTQVIGNDGTKPVWTAMATRESMALLNSVTATGATINSGSFASVATSYIAIKAEVKGLRVATTTHLALRTSSDGINYAATTDAYSYSMYNLTATATGISLVAATTDTAIALTATGAAAIRGLATYIGASWSGEIILFNLDGISFPHIHVVGGFGGANDHVSYNGSGRRKETITQAGIQLMLPNAGSFIDGRVDFFGIKGP